MLVKICGVRTAEEALTAEAYGADWIGFIMAPSRRRVTPAKARMICRRLTRAQRVGVFVDAPLALVREPEPRRQRGEAVDHGAACGDEGGGDGLHLVNTRGGNAQGDVAVRGHLTGVAQHPVAFVGEFSERHAVVAGQ